MDNCLLACGHLFLGPVAVIPSQPLVKWVWVKLNYQGTIGFGPCCHLPGQPILGLPYF